MDLYHRDSRGKDTPIGRDCQFCRSADPEFSQRKPIDRLVQSKLGDTASAHLSEDGYVKHRIAELAKKHSASFLAATFSKTA